jgi:S-adenosylmethionine-diacylglycerol 3-amino-3-carboxypropyl transferase
MSTTTNGQVQLSKLIFTQNWEDPEVDEKALLIQNGDTVFTITSGGCNTLGFLRFEPAAIYCVDINAAQTYLMELKKAAFWRLSHQEMWSFFGLTKTPDRKRLYEKLRDDLSPDAKVFFDARPRLIAKGILMNGRYEKFVRLAGRLLRMLQGPGNTKRFFTLNTLEDQQRFYEKRWDNGRWRWVFQTMFNKKRLAKKGLNADYFHFDDGSSSFSESFYKRAGHAMKDLPIQRNYFLSLYLLGKYENYDALPAYLQAQNFSVIRRNIDHVHPVTADSKLWLADQPDNMFDAFALSNICELMDDQDTYKLFKEVLRTAKPGARVIFRNLMIPREVPKDLQENIVKNEVLSRQLQYSDRSFVYGKVAAYNIIK